MSVKIQKLSDKAYLVNGKYVYQNMSDQWGAPQEALEENEIKEFQSYLKSGGADEKNDLEKVKKLIDAIDARILDTKVSFRVEHDNEFANGRIFIQPTYFARCTKTNTTKNWHGRKWYLSRHMTDDEIIKTAYAGFESAVKHEAMEGFRVHGQILFNPHTHYESLLEISSVEVKRNEHQTAK